MTKHEQDISELKEKLLTMAGYAEASVSNAVRALMERNDELARQVKECDNKIDELEIEIDEMAIHLLSKAPLATDLRLITVAMKISQNLERVGDEATTIARRALDLNKEPRSQSHVDVPRMAVLALQMLKAALDAFVNKQSAVAEAIIPRDEEVDQIHKQFHRELLGYMAENPSAISSCLNLMTVSKSLERIADHATNIAEEVVYLCEARDIRHMGH